jgi:hypothetical protein
LTPFPLPTRSFLLCATFLLLFSPAITFYGSFHGGFGTVVFRIGTAGRPPNLFSGDSIMAGLTNVMEVCRQDGS